MSAPESKDYFCLSSDVSGKMALDSKVLRTNPTAVQWRRKSSAETRKHKHKSYQRRQRAPRLHSYRQTPAWGISDGHSASMGAQTLFTTSIQKKRQKNSRQSY
uniref:Uncharacterized protein n=1 Tax=Photinus pyralis TaxID=7054 RepID=A0A1Y1L6J5_PHOPY